MSDWSAWSAVFRGIFEAPCDDELKPEAYAHCGKVAGELSEVERDFFEYLIEKGKEL
jgi:hypothetical protein